MSEKNNEPLLTEEHSRCLAQMADGMWLLREKYSESVDAAMARLGWLQKENNSLRDELARALSRADSLKNMGEENASLKSELAAEKARTVPLVVSLDAERSRCDGLSAELNSCKQDLAASVLREKRIADMEKAMERFATLSHNLAESAAGLSEDLGRMREEADGWTGRQS